MKLKEKLFEETFILLKKNNVKIKLVLYGDTEVINLLEKAFNIPIRKVTVEAKFFIVDRKEVLFYVSKDKGKEDQAIWLNSEFFSEAFAGLFDLAMKA